MTKTVIVTVATSPVEFPAGTVSSGIKVSMQLTGGTLVSQTLSEGPFVATFVGVEAGEYTITSQAYDANGIVLGSPASVVQVIAADAPNTVKINHIAPYIGVSYRYNLKHLHLF